MKLAADWLSSPEVKTLGEAFARTGHTLRFVGGCVRDTILNRPFTEIDAATDAAPEDVITLLEAAGLRAIPTGLAHGTITALVGDKYFEITTLRKDIATDGRHAEVAFTDSWEEDAKRRDFTMNALYADSDGTVHDYVGGLADCRAKHVRFIGNAGMRIQEDYLRILRYFRFVAQLEAAFDDAALAACTAHKDGIRQLSGERIQQELLKLLAAGRSHMAVEKLLPLIPPPLGGRPGGGHAIARLEQLISPSQPSSGSALLKLAALIGDAASLPTVAERLKLSSKQSRSLQLWLTHYTKFSPSMSTLEQQKLVRKLGGADYLAALQLAYALSDKGWKDFEPLAAMKDWQPPAFPVTAKDLMARGYSEGKALGDALRVLEEKWEESGYRLMREALLSNSS